MTDNLRLRESTIREVYALRASCRVVLREHSAEFNSEPAYSLMWDKASSLLHTEAPIGYTNITSVMSIALDDGKPVEAVIEALRALGCEIIAEDEDEEEAGDGE